MNSPGINLANNDKQFSKQKISLGSSVNLKIIKMRKFNKTTKKYIKKS
jgi:hypothetical protein